MKVLILFSFYLLIVWIGCSDNTTNPEQNNIENDGLNRSDFIGKWYRADSINRHYQYYSFTDTICTYEDSGPPPPSPSLLKANSCFLVPYESWHYSQDTLYLIVDSSRFDRYKFKFEGKDNFLLFIDSINNRGKYAGNYDSINIWEKYNRE